MAKRSRFITPPVAVDSISSTHDDGERARLASWGKARHLHRLWYRLRSCPLQKTGSLWRGKLLLSLGLRSALDERWPNVWQKKARTLSFTTALLPGRRSRQSPRSKNWAVSYAIAADLTNVAEIKRLFDEAAKQFGRLDILVNSAANFLPSSVVSTTEEIWDASLATNLKAPFFCAQAAAPLLRRTKGTIINFADTGGLLGWPGYIAHSVSKAGVEMLTKVLAKALGPEVRVNAIAPGTVTMPGDPPEWEADFTKLAPLRGTGTPSDIADAVVFLVHSKFMTGQVLVVDGGRTLL